jgi:hypothetical protein
LQAPLRPTMQMNEPAGTVSFLGTLRPPARFESPRDIGCDEAQAVEVDPPRSDGKIVGGPHADKQTPKNVVEGNGAAPLATPPGSGSRPE